MLVYAAIDLATALPLVIGLMGLGGLVFTALRFRRDDTTAVIDQQSKITAEMKTLSDEQRAHLAEVREERDALKVQVDRLTAQVDELRAQGGPVARRRLGNDA
jgi:vacuolar-type H+-ATPase subunit I/STV1